MEKEPCWLKATGRKFHRPSVDGKKIECWAISLAHTRDTEGEPEYHFPPAGKIVNALSSEHDPA